MKKREKQGTAIITTHFKEFALFKRNFYVDRTVNAQDKTVRKAGDGCPVASVLTFYSDNPSLNLSEVSGFSVKMAIEKIENKQNQAALSHFYKISRNEDITITRSNSYKPLLF